ncbi:hypothetical protein MMC31_008203 [Peltigera leucophlebia]|nr:hypothetical protein [Peltigera leucophlebia]
MINPEAQPFSLCPGKEVPIVHLTDGKTKKIWLTFGFPRPTATNALSAYAAPTWQASFALPHGPGTIEVDENYCLNIVVGGGAKQQCLQRSCLNRKPSDGEPVRELNPYNLWNYYNDQIPDTRATCPGNDGASIPGNTGQIVGFNSGDEYVEPTIQAVSISTESEGEGVVSNNDIVGAAGSVPSVTDRPVPVDSLGFNSIPGSALPHAFNNNNNNNRAPMAAIPGDPYSDSNNSPINSWGETVMDWNKKNKRAAKLARRKFLRGLHGSE